jgi:hypothetical protein
MSRRLLEETKTAFLRLQIDAKRPKDGAHRILTVHVASGKMGVWTHAAIVYGSTDANKRRKSLQTSSLERFV